MNRADFEFLASILKQRSGLVLAPEKAYLLESRLMPVARKFGFTGLPELIVAVRTERPEDLLRDITEAMTTNESLFFRDMKPFEQFRNLVIPKLVEARHSTRKIRIWSAAASSGQEPYSIAIILTEMQSLLAGWDVEITATDISVEMLNRARSGLYTQFEVQRGLPIQSLMQHFAQEGEQWRIGKKLRERVEFRQVNLLSDFSRLGTFDVVFCRNVLIYFDRDTKLGALDRIAKVLAPDGYLILGAAETMVGLGNQFAPVPEKRALYQPREAVARTRPLTQVSGGTRVA